MNMKYLIVLSFLLLTFPLAAQTAKESNMNNRELQNKALLKELVDNFSILADKKEAQKQTLLFTQDAVVETYLNGKFSSRIQGRKEIGDTFGGFLKNFETVYHFNGQFVVNINGNKADGILYCLTYLFSSENGKKIRTTFGIHYNDEYVFENGQWLIAKRTSYFDWQDRQELNQ